LLEDGLPEQAKAASEPKRALARATTPHAHFGQEGSLPSKANGRVSRGLTDPVASSAQVGKLRARFDPGFCGRGGK